MGKGPNYQAKMLKGIQEVSLLFDVPKPTLRYYEEMGLFHTQRDSSSNYRKYTLTSITEISDVILYRNLNIPIKDIQNLMELPIDATEELLTQAAEQTQAEIEKMKHALAEIQHRQKRISIYNQLRNREPCLVKNQDLTIQKIISWDIESPKSMKEYIHNPYTSPYVIYISDVQHPEKVQEGLVADDTDNRIEVIWEAPNDPKFYIQCMVRTEYSYLDVVELSELLDRIREQGYTPISLLGEYLLSDIDPKDGKKYDYFCAWINVICDSDKHSSM